MEFRLHFAGKVTVYSVDRTMNAPQQLLRDAHLIHVCPVFRTQIVTIKSDIHIVIVVLV